MENVAPTRQLCVGQCSLGQEQACSDLCHTEHSSSLHRMDEYPVNQQHDI